MCVCTDRCSNWMCINYCAEMRFANFQNAIVTDADFDYAYWHQTIWTDGNRYDSEPSDDDEGGGDDEG